MGKMKVHELAKELELSSKDLMDKLKKIGIEAKSHLSTLEDDEIKLIKEKLAKKTSSKAKPKKVQEEKER